MGTISFSQGQEIYNVYLQGQTALVRKCKFLAFRGETSVVIEDDAGVQRWVTYDRLYTKEADALKQAAKINGLGVE